MAPVRRLVLDLMKPYDPPTVDFAKAVADMDGIHGVNAVLIEVDEKVENLKLTIEGEDIDVDEVTDVIESLGGSVHSVDEVVCGELLIEESQTPQD